MSEAGSAGRYSLLAIVLPFVGLVIGATLEHGAGFLCKLGVVECKASPSQTQALENTIAALIRQTEALSEQNRACLASIDAALGNIRTAEAQIRTNPRVAMQSLRTAQTQLNPDVVFATEIPGLNINEIESVLPRLAPELRALDANRGAIER